MPSPIPPPDGHYITLAQFQQMKQLYADNSEKILAPPYKGQNILVTSELFNIIPVNVLAAVPGCAGMRICYGMSADLKVHAMMVAVDQNGQDILPTGQQGATFARSSDAPPMLEEGSRCPPDCP